MLTPVKSLNSSATRPIAADCFDARGRHIKLARVSLCVGDQFGHAVDRDRRVHNQHTWRLHQACDRHDTHEVEIEIAVQRRVDRVRLRDQENRVAVRRCIDDVLGREIATRSRLILDRELLTEALEKMLAGRSAMSVGSPAA